MKLSDEVSSIKDRYLFVKKSFEKGFYNGAKLYCHRNDYYDELIILMNKINSILKNSLSNIDCYFLEHLKTFIINECQALSKNKEDYLIKKYYFLFFKDSIKKPLINEELLIGFFKFISLKKIREVSLSKTSYNILKRLNNWFIESNKNTNILDELLNKNKTDIKSNIENYEKNIFSQEDLYVYLEKIERELLTALENINSTNNIGNTKIISKDKILDYLKNNLFMISKLTGEEIQIKIINENFSAIVPDAGYLSKQSLNTNYHVLVLNSSFLDADKTERQLKLLISHEIYPGHMYHSTMSLKSKFSDFGEIGDNKLVSEGWAIYSEYMIGEEDPSLRELFLVQYSRRCVNALYSINLLLGKSKLECSSYIDNLLSRFNINHGYLRLIKYGKNFNLNSINYVYGFISIKELIVSYELTPKVFMKFGAIDINIIKKNLESKT
ncbi:DUF885 family protein [Heyndrickxia sp. FSL W8-0423]|uniref:DUF885 family protein n=1 Tax=Heyndrickxia sp. FSL W8-0423 TaxID=2921601 RepID=UPI0030F8B522